MLYLAKWIVFHNGVLIFDKAVYKFATDLKIMDGTSLTPEQEKLNALKQVLPEVFAEGKVDWEKLKATLGEDINFSNERYVLNWAGKSEAFKVLQEPTTKTLIPSKDESVNFDDTKHIFIEGENLEVLKVLQKSYFGKVKMIYIYPPYNTGNDSFIYPDKFSETKAEYEKRVGDKDEEGYMTKDGMFKKNSKENGQYHSNWLNMMMPRLYLAKNLLKKDGVIFISIDDNEVHNLRLLMNEIFGEENFEAQISWRRRHNQPNDKTKMVAKVSEYILVYSKNAEYLKKVKSYYGLPISERRIKDYKNPDNDPRGRWSSNPWKAAVGRGGSRYKLKTITGKVLDEIWYGNEDSFNQLVEENRIHWTDNGNGFPRVKIYLDEAIKSGQAGINFFKHEKFGSNQEGSSELKELLLIDGLFDNPKPMRLLKALIKLATLKDGDIILDFFGGSGSIGQAVFELNDEEKTKRNFICVQLDERCEKKSVAYKAGYESISELALDRIKKASDKVRNAQSYDKNDLGFKVLKLSDSNFKQWQQITGKDKQALEEQMKLFVDPVSKNATTENMVYELLLKSGKDLNSTIEEKEGFYAINETELVLVLERANQKIIDSVISCKPQKVIALDKLFKGNDQLKTNTSLQMKDACIEFKTI